MKSILASLFVSSLVLCSACGGSQPAADAPAAPTPEKPAPAADPAPAEPAPEAAPAAPTEPEPEPVSKPSRPPVDVIAAPDMAFVINYASSALEAAAEKKCGGAGDAAAQAACKQKERGEFMADVIQFKRDKDESVTWIVHRRKGSTLIRLHASPVKLTQKSENTVTVEITDDDKKPRVLFPNKRKFDVVVPNDYSIEIDEPRLGKLVYDAKIGIVGK